MKCCIHFLPASTIFFLIATFWTNASWAQTRIWGIGFLSVPHYSQDDARNFPIYRTLSDHGWVVGKDVIFELRDGGGDPTRLAEPAAELVRLKVDVLLPTGPAAVRAAFGATKDIPIVAYDLESDPVAERYVQSLSRPGGNVTGIFLDAPELAGKWVELLKTIIPRLSRVVVLKDSSTPPLQLDAVREAASELGIKQQVLEIHTAEDIAKAPFAFRGRPQAMIVLPSPMLWGQNARLAQLAKKHRLPAIAMFLPFADAGGMLAYGPDIDASYHQADTLIEKILKGAKPGDLPIERPAKFDFVLNLKTARDLHLIVPDTILLRADRVIK